MKVSWVGELVSVFWWMELDIISLEGSGVSSSEFRGIFGFGMALGSLSFNVQGSVLVLLEEKCEVYCTEAYWLFGRVQCQYRYGGFWVSSCLLMFPGVRSSTMV